MNISTIDRWWILAAVLLALVSVAMVAFIRVQRRLTSPDRLRRFLDELEAIDWRPKRNQAPDVIARAVVELLHHEVEYYYKLRNRRSAVAMLTRLLAFVFGTIGLLSPLIAATIPDGSWRMASQFGYVMLAAAAAALAANQLFGATSGHIQFVTAQYKLEKLIHDFGVNWQAWRAEAQSLAPGDWESRKSELLAKAFDLLRDLSKNAYEVIGGETEAWANTLIAAEAQYRQGIAR